MSGRESCRIVIGEDEMLFSKAGPFFSKNLRKVALYLPPYIDQKDAEGAFMEVSNG